MKKLVALLLATVMCVSLAACGGGTGSSACTHENIITQNGVAATCTSDGLSDGKVCASCNKVLVEQTKVPTTGHQIAALEAKEASCTSNGSKGGEGCSLCGMVTKEGEVIPALGHTGEWSCERCSYSGGSWGKYFFTDEFNDPTDEWYIGMKANTVGTFSNSATTDSKLEVYILYGQTNDYPDLPFGGTGLGTDYFNIFLYEYGRNLVKNSSSYYVDEYDITMKTADGTKHNLTGTIYCGGDRLYIDDAYKTRVLEALKSGENVSFYIVESERTTTTYLFSVATSNFAEEYAALMG